MLRPRCGIYACRPSSVREDVNTRTCLDVRSRRAYLVGWLRRLEMGVLMAIGGVFLSLGCRERTVSYSETTTTTRADTGTRLDAVVREVVREETKGPWSTYKGTGWLLEVSREAGWRREPDHTSTLQLVRNEAGVRLHLKLRVYRIRDGMEPRTFLAAHAMWLAEEGEPRVEYAWDEELAAWQGYAVGAGKESYYHFQLAGDRALVLEEWAEGATLSATAADEFKRIAAGLKCARTSTASAANDATARQEKP